MTTFDDRVKNFEAEYLHEQELVFKIKARQYSLFAKWAIEQINIEQEEADSLVKTVINLSFIADGSSKAVDIIENLFSNQNFEMSRHRVEKEFLDFLDIAHNQLKNG